MDLNRYHFTFDPRKKGLRKILADLEADVMEAVWARGRATVHDVHERLEAADRELAYTSELLDDFTAPAMSQFVELMGEQDEAAIEALAQAIEEKRRRGGSDV